MTLFRDVVRSGMASGNRDEVPPAAYAAGTLVCGTDFVAGLVVQAAEAALPLGGAEGRQFEWLLE